MMLMLLQDQMEISSALAMMDTFLMKPKPNVWWTARTSTIQSAEKMRMYAVASLALTGLKALSSAS